MNIYKHILLATDFSECCDDVSAKAKTMAENSSAKLSIVHIVDYLPSIDSLYGPVIPAEIDLTEQLLSSAKEQVASKANNLNIPNDQQWVELGSPKYEIVRIAEENQVDLIVLGSHGRHGLGLLLGSTANGVLHHAKCDVLAIRLHEN